MMKPFITRDWLQNAIEKWERNERSVVDSMMTLHLGTVSVEGDDTGGVIQAILVHIKNLGHTDCEYANSDSRAYEEEDYRRRHDGWAS